MPVLMIQSHTVLPNCCDMGNRAITLSPFSRRWHMSVDLFTASLVQAKGQQEQPPRGSAPGAIEVLINYCPWCGKELTSKKRTREY